MQLESENKASDVQIQNSTQVQVNQDSNINPLIYLTIFTIVRTKVFMIVLTKLDYTKINAILHIMSNNIT